MNDYKLGFLFLGAGSSSRMLGDDKLLKKVNGVTQIQKILNEALALSTPDAYNPFCGPDCNDESPFTIDIVRANTTSLYMLDFKASTGDLFELPAGSVGMLVGFEARKESYQDKRDPRINGEFIINPSAAQLAEADIDLMVGASKEFVAMVEGEMDEVSEEEMAEAIKFAHEAIKVQCDAQVALAEAFGKKETREYEGEAENEELKAKITELSKVEEVKEEVELSEEPKPIKANPENKVEKEAVRFGKQGKSKISSILEKVYN